MTKEQLILQSSLEACRQRTEKLRYSIDKNAHLFPITLAQLAAFNDEQEESVDALILRYSQCVTMIQEQLFRGIAFLEHRRGRLHRQQPASAGAGAATFLPFLSMSEKDSIHQDAYLKVLRLWVLVWVKPTFV